MNKPSKFEVIMEDWVVPIALIIAIVVWGIQILGLAVGKG